MSGAATSSSNRPGGSAESLTGAQAFHQAGDRVQLLVLAVRAADSRQVTALRYAKAQQLGNPARFTSASGHDRCYQAMAEVVDGAGSPPAVDEVVVVGRDGRAP
ncbi:hypothetical protein J2S46_000466 [Kitasatospora herbaricolor]|uniref:zeta toxin family protein n=1 Tax=Kitasatospora herbaricolor TaxID=68217 RepID=UPI002790C1D4|nr:zeta toxin family protein [Kitasatospora herbaricolor]MDQ0305910.1 hypothetical protein [Kitasatospora herbaricolor]